MRRSGFKRGMTLVEVELAAVAGLLLFVSFVQVDREVRRSVETVYREAFLETAERELASDLGRWVPPGLAGSLDRAAPARSITAGGASLGLAAGAPSGADWLLRFTPQASGAVDPGGALALSADGGASWRSLLGLGVRGMLEALGFSYGGWIAPGGSVPAFELDERVRYRLVRAEARLNRPGMVPYAHTFVWAPRALRWSWFGQSQQGAHVPYPDEGVFYPMAIHRGALPGGPNQPFDFFAIGPGAGNIGWLSWTGDPSTPTLASALGGPSSNTYTDPQDPSGNDHLVTIGSWIPTTPGHHNGVQGALNDLIGRSITVVVWEDSQGQGHNTYVQAAGFARVRVQQADLPHLIGVFEAWVDDQGREIPSPGASPAPTPAPSAVPTAAPTAAAAAVLPLAINAPLTLKPGTDLGWLHGGADFAWLAWSGDTSLAALQAGLSPTGTAGGYTNPLDPSDHTLEAGKSVIGYKAAGSGRELEGNLASLVGRTVVVPIFDQVTDDRFHVSGFGLVRLEDYHAASFKLRVTYVGPCDAAGRPL